MAERIKKLRQRRTNMSNGGKQKRFEAIQISKVYTFANLDEHGEQFASKNGMIFL